MEDVKLKLIKAETAAEAAEGVALGDEARARLEPPTGVHAYLHRLAEAGLWPDAFALLTHALPKREAIWWACKCVRNAAGPPPSVMVADAVAAAERWVTDPSEEHRRAAFELANRAGVGTPAGLTAMAAFWSGGSLAPASLPEVPPGEQFTPRAVAGAILMAGVLAEPEKAPTRYRRYLDLGLAIANALDLPPTLASATKVPTLMATPRRTASRIADTWE